MKNTESISAINRQARDQFGGLSLMFLLGMGVNLIGLPSATAGSANTATTILLSLHVLIGIALILGAIFAFVKARKTDFMPLARVGLVAIVLTFTTGAMTITTGNNWWSYAMSIGFIANLWVYGLLFMKTRTAMAKSLQ